MFHQLIAAAETMRSVKEFVEGGTLLQILTTLGDIEYQAAILALNNWGHSNNPSREIELAIGHLQTAHLAFKAQWNIQGPKKGFNITKVRDAEFKDAWTTALMALCYKALGDNPMAIRCVDWASEALSGTDYANDDLLTEVGGMVSVLVNPYNWFKLAKEGDRPSKWHIEWEQIYEFRKKITSEQ